MSDRFLYQVATTPTCGVGLKKTEVAAPDQVTADARVVEMIRAWTQGWADQDRITYRWRISRSEREVASGAAQPT